MRILIRGVAGYETSIFAKAQGSAERVPRRIRMILGLGDLDYAADDFIGGEDLAAIEDDDEMDFMSLDLDGDDAEFAEIELDTMVRTASQVDMPVLQKDADSSDGFQAWDDIFG